MSERILIDQLKQKDESSFRKIVESCQDMVYSTALGFLENSEDAEDVAQEVFVQLYESIHSFKGESKLSTWLYRVTVTKCLDHLRKKKRKKRMAYIQGLFGADNEILHEPPDFVHPGVVLDNKERAKVLYKAIQNLPANQKTAFILNKQEGLNYYEIGEIMKTSVSAIESLLHRAKINLRTTLKDFYLQLE